MQPVGWHPLGQATDIWVCLKIVYPYTQWLMIIIPTKWLFFWGVPHFQTYPFERPNILQMLAVGAVRKKC